MVIWSTSLVGCETEIQMFTSNVPNSMEEILYIRIFLPAKI